MVAGTASVTFVLEVFSRSPRVGLPRHPSWFTGSIKDVMDHMSINHYLVAGQLGVQLTLIPSVTQFFEGSAYNSKVIGRTRT